MRPRILLLSFVGTIVALVLLSLVDSLLVDLLWFSTLGYRQVFVPVRTGAAGPMATREYFPRRFGAAISQRTRWVTGIALQSWQRHGWSAPWPQLYWFWRDRKGLVGNLLSPAANLVCLEDALNDLDTESVHAAVAAKAWAVGDLDGVKAHYSETRLDSCLQQSGTYAALLFPLDEHKGGPPFSVSLDETLTLFRKRKFRLKRREIPEDSVWQRRGLEELVVFKVPKKRAA